MIINEYKLSMTPQFNTSVVWVSQYDTGGRTLKFNLFANGAPLEIPSGTTAVINGVKPDGAVYSYPMTVGDTYVQIELQEQMTAVAGAVTAEIVLTDSSGNVGTANFTMMVERSPLDEGVISDSEITEFQQALDSAQQTLQQAQTVYDSIPSDYTALSNNVDALNDATTYFGNGMPLELTWHYGYIKASDLSIVNSGSTHVYSDVVMIPAGNMLYLPRVNKSTSVTLLALCDSTGRPQQVLLQGVSSGNSTHEHILYPFFEDTYVRIGGNMSESAYMKYYIKPIAEDYTFDESTFALFNSVKTLSYTQDKAATSSSFPVSTGMLLSDKICLPKGMTLEYWGCGSGVDGLITVVGYPAVGSPTAPYPTPVTGTSLIQHGEYTATDHMYVRLCARVAPMEGTDYLAVLPEAVFKNWKIYYKPTHYSEEVKHSYLYGKHLTVMGDSLVYGNQLGPEATWINAIGLRNNMTVTNLGVNSSAVAAYTSNSMVNRLSTIPSDTDFFILEGGANDKNGNIPIGELNSTDTATFCGALNTIIDYVRQNLPKARFGLMTNWQRFVTLNEQGNNEESYVNAMVAVAHNKSVPVFDNYHGCGLTFYNEDLSAWIDEGKDRQRLTNGVVEYYNDGRVGHFSVAAYEWLVPLYEQFLLNMRSTGDSGVRKLFAQIEDYYVKSCADRYTTFESGTIQSTGAEATSSTFSRSGYIPIDDFIRVDKPIGVKLYPCIYKEENGQAVFIKRMSLFDDGYVTTISKNTLLTYDASVKYVRFVASNGALETGLNIWIAGNR